MAIGVGAGINLGSATAFLFVDASGMRRGLQQAEAALNSFEKKQEQTARAVGRSQAANITATITGANAIASTGPDITGANDKAAEAAKNATRIIDEAYQERNRAINAHAQLVARLGPQIAGEEQNISKLVQERVAAEKRASDIENQLNRTGAAAPTSRVSAQLNAELNEIRGAGGKIAQINQQIGDSFRKLAPLQTQVGQSANQTGAIVVAANNRERVAVEQLQKALSEQSASYRALAANAGPQFEKLAERAEATGQRVLQSAQRVAQAEVVLQNAQARRANASAPDMQAAVIAEEAADRRVTAARAAMDRALTAHERAERNFTNAFLSEASRREQIAQQEEQRVVAAKAAEGRAATQLAEQRLQSGFQALQTGAIAATVAIGGATKAFVDYNTQLVNVASISEGVLTNVDAMKSHIDQLSTTFGKAPEEIAKGLYDITQAGIQGDEAFSILDTATRAAVAGLTDVTTAATPIIGVLNAYGKGAYTAAQASDILFAAVTDGVFSFAQLSGQLGDNLSIASALGVSLQELSAVYVVLTRRGNSMAESATQVNAIMNAFIKPSSDLEDAFAKLGLGEANLYFRTHDLGDVLGIVNKLFQENADKAGQLFPNLRALRGVYGLTTDGVKSFNVELDKLNHASDGAGRTSQVLAVQMQALGFKLAQAREALRQVAIQFGSDLAPGVLIAAKVMGIFATALEHALSMGHGFLGIAAGIGGTFVIMGAGVARFVYFMKQGIDGIKGLGAELIRLNQWLTTTERGMQLMSFVTNPLVLAAAALAVGIGVLVTKWRAHSKAIAEVQASYKNLDQTIADLQNNPSFTSDQAASAKALGDQLQKVIQYSKDLHQAQITSQAFNNDGKDWYHVATAIDSTGKAIRKTNESWDDWQNTMDSSKLSAGNVKKLQDDLSAILGRGDLDIDAFIKAFDDLQKKLISGDITPQGFLAQMDKWANDSKTFTHAAAQAAAAQTKLGQSLVNTNQFFGDAASAADDYRQGLQNLVKQSYQTLGVLSDFSDPLSFINSQLKLVGGTANQAFARLGQMGVIKFNGPTQQAINLLAQIDASQAKIDKLTSSIQSDQSAMSSWENIISTVSNTVGTTADGFAGLQTMVKRHELTTEEAAKIQQAAIYLNNQAAISIEDERVAVAKSLPDLAAFVAQHQGLLDQYKALTPEARGAAEALQDQKNQALLLIGVMVKLAEAMNPDIFPKEFVTRFFADVSQADPAAAALFARYGLIPQEVDTTFKAYVGNSIDTLDEVNKKIDETQKKLDVALTQPRSQKNDTVIARLRAELDALTKRKNDINVGIVGPKPNNIPDISRQMDGLSTEVSQKAKDLASAWQSAFDSMSNSTADVSKRLADAIPQLFKASIAVDDFSDPIKSLTTNYSGLHKGIEEVLLSQAKLGNVKLSIDEKGALQTASNLKEVEARIDKISASIQQDQGDMSMWQQRIDLVDNTLGDSTDTLSQYQQALAEGRITQAEYNKAIADGSAHVAYSKLQQLLDTGRISQKQYNEILKAGIWLRERSVGGVLDEEAEIAKSLPALAKYVAKHDELDGKYKHLTDDQKGFLAAINQQNVATALSTALLIKQLEAQGLAAQGSAQKFIDTVAASDPEIRAVFKDLGLIEGNHKVTVSINVDNKGKIAFEQLNQQLGMWEQKRVEASIALDADPNNQAALAQLEQANANIALLEREKVILYIEAKTGHTIDSIKGIDKVLIQLQDDGTIHITGDPKDVQNVIDQLKKEGIPDKDIKIVPQLDKTPQEAVTDATKDKPPVAVPVTPTPVGDASSTTSVNLPTVPDQTFKVTADVSPALAAISTFQGQMDTLFVAIAADAATMGEYLGITFDDAFAKAIIDESKAVTSAVYTGPVLTLYDANDVIRKYGASAGIEFDYGIAEGMYDGQGTSAIQAAARYVALLAYFAAIRALIIRSPSKKGAYIGEMFVKGITNSILDEGDHAVAATKKVAERITNAMKLSPVDVPGMRVSGALPVTAAGVRAATIPSSITHSTIIQANADVKVTDSGNPRETAKLVADSVWQQLHEAFTSTDAKVSR